MPRKQFEQVMKREWRPVQLKGDAVPRWLRGIPENIVHSIYASGSEISGLEYNDTYIPSGRLIGNLEVYRNAADDPVKLNKDGYPIISVRGTDSMVLVRGPMKDSEHWIDEIPSRFKGVEVLGVPPLNDTEA
ncbi:MAG: hypothetical protein PHR77_03550 [Kiritimatiellae bacterium]|nr:hypothetical protein [Kiritimatiellia bacterium]